MRRRATGAIYNACSDDTALEALVDVGAASALALHLKATHIQPVSLKALERLCLISAVAREDATNALPDGELTQRLADLLTLRLRLCCRRCNKGARVKADTASPNPNHAIGYLYQSAESLEWPDDSIVYYTALRLSRGAPSV